MDSSLSLRDLCTKMKRRIKCLLMSKSLEKTFKKKYFQVKIVYLTLNNYLQENKPKAGFLGELTVEENLFDKHVRNVNRQNV